MGTAAARPVFESRRATLGYVIPLIPVVGWSLVLAGGPGLHGALSAWGYPVALAGSILALVQYYRVSRTKLFLKMDEGVLFSTIRGGRRAIRWSDVQEFSIRGQLAPHGVAILKNGKMVSIDPLYDRPLSLRAHPPSPELIRTMEDLEHERRLRAQP